MREAGDKFVMCKKEYQIKVIYCHKKLFRKAIKIAERVIVDNNITDEDYWLAFHEPKNIVGIPDPQGIFVGDIINIEKSTT